MKPKVILISQFPLPYSKIGSWTTLYTNYLKGNHQIDCVICEKPKILLNTVNYEFAERTRFEKIKQKATKNVYKPYLYALSKITRAHKGQFIIQVVDNFGLIPHLNIFLKQLGIRGQCHIQFFYHGFAPFFGNLQGRTFFTQIDEMVLLTHDSYLVHKDYYTILPCLFSVLHNGIDTAKFFKVSEAEKAALKQRYQVAGKTVFLWCSQDRPKKGLDLILKVWKLLMQDHDHLALLVVGCERQEPIKGVRFIGKVPNDELPVYYQVSDCYIFPTLCHEGFGMTLIEALHSGCYVIASAIGGVPEVLQYGTYGTLINEPHFVDEWVGAISDFLSNTSLALPNLPENMYTSEQWRVQMTAIISKTKKLL